MARPNRFLVVVDCGGRELEAHCADPGRLEQILVPGCTVLVVARSGANRRTAHTLVAAEYRGHVIPLLSAAANAAMEALVLRPRHPAARIRREYPVGRVRLDFAVEEADSQQLIEVKACTLVEHSVALFPDAPTARGLRQLHQLRQLNRLPGPGQRGSLAKILFAVMNPEARVLVPNLHVDPAFSAGLLAAAGEVQIEALALRVGRDGRADVVGDVPLDLDRVASLRPDSGCYLLTVELAEATELQVGALGSLRLAAGYYVYVGSALRNLWQRLARHRRRRKRSHWHIDYLTLQARHVATHAVVSGARLECHAARLVAAVADGEVAEFGSSDCDCSSHLFFFDRPPLLSAPFRRVLARLRHHDAWLTSGQLAGAEQI